MMKSRMREGDKLIPLPHLPVQTKLRIRGMIKVRDAVRQCLRTQLEDADENLKSNWRATNSIKPTTDLSAVSVQCPIA